MSAITLDRRKLALALFLLILLLASAAIYYFYFYRQQLARTAEREELLFTGTVEATVSLAAFKVPGRVAELEVHEGSEVKEGQLLARLESREIEAKLAQAEGALAAAQGQVEQADNNLAFQRQQVEAKIQQAQALVAQAQCGLRNVEEQAKKAEVGVKDAEDQLQNARDLYQRLQFLHAQGAVDARKLEEARVAYERAQNACQAAQIERQRAQNACESARQKLAEAQAALEQALSGRTGLTVFAAQAEAARGQAEQADGAVREARALLDNTRLLAPMAGFITRKFVEKGEMVNAGSPVYEVADLRHPYVKIYVSETKIGRVRLGQKAEIRVEAFPDRTFTGTVVRIAEAGEFAVKKPVSEQRGQDIRSFEVKIDLANPELLLKPGMTARVRLVQGGRG
ncbi:HlyD family secretion protein [Desulfothermobacter acidiphilus]|uniref:HlyD family secretion protein n=1 Tax=Desulfothermobacter acidiphilus TaxID=1938353 RepID=UPI003F8B4749